MSTKGKTSENFRHPLQEYDLKISDSEILAYLYGVTPEQRERYVLTALRIGFLTLSEAKPDLNRQALQDMTAQLCALLERQRQSVNADLQALATEQGPIHSTMNEAVRRLSELFQDSNPAGLPRQLASQLEKEVNKLSQEWSLDHQGSAFTRMQRLLQEHGQQMTSQIQQTVQELRGLWQEQQIRKDEALKGTRHGQEFEQMLNEQLQSLCGRQNHHYEPTGEVVGMIKNCKVGDGVITLSSEHVAAGARIVVEAKQSKSYTTKKALAEIDLAKQNRDADVGVFVLSTISASKTWPPFQRFDHNLLVVWDAEDPGTDLFLEAALSVATALCSKRHYHAAELPDFLPMQQALVDLDNALQGLGEMQKLATTIHSNSEKIVKRCELMAQETKVKMDDLGRNIDQLRRLDIALFAQ